MRDDLIEEERRVCQLIINKVAEDKWLRPKSAEDDTPLGNRFGPSSTTSNGWGLLLRYTLAALQYPYNHIP